MKRLAISTCSYAELQCIFAKNHRRNYSDILVNAHLDSLQQGLRVTQNLAPGAPDGRKISGAKPLKPQARQMNDIIDSGLPTTNEVMPGTIAPGGGGIRKKKFAVIRFSTKANVS
jgi:hypothetical protein